MRIKPEREDGDIAGVLRSNDGSDGSVLYLANVMRQREGGTHIPGVRGARTRQVTDYAETMGGARKVKVDLAGDDRVPAQDSGQL